MNELKGADKFTWIGAAYTLSSTAFQPLSGALADVFGRRPCMLWSLCLFALGSAVCGAAKDISMLIAGRSESCSLLFLVHVTASRASYFTCRTGYGKFITDVLLLFFSTVSVVLRQRTDELFDQPSKVSVPQASDLSPTLSLPILYHSKIEVRLWVYWLQFGPSHLP